MLLMLVPRIAEWISRRTAIGRALKDGANMPLLAPSGLWAAILTGALRTAPENSLRQVVLMAWMRVADVAIWIRVELRQVVLATRPRVVAMLASGAPKVAVKCILALTNGDISTLRSQIRGRR